MEESIKDYISNLKELLNSDLSQMINTAELISKLIIKAFKRKKKVVFFGNGGSSSQAAHLAAELAGKFLIDREPLNAFSLDNREVLTAIANDYSYSKVFSRMVKAYCQEGDIAVGLSTSGNSENVINGLKEAKKIGCITIAFTRKDGGKLKAIADVALAVPSQSTSNIQEMHLVFGHAICKFVEKELF